MWCLLHIPEARAFLRRLGAAEFRRTPLGWSAAGDGWRARVGNVAYDLLAADAEAAGEMRRRGIPAPPPTRTRPPPPVFGIFFSRTF